MAGKRPLVAGNWKMNGLGASLAEIKALKERLMQSPVPEAEVMICPPATLLAQARWALTGSDILLGAQDCHTLPSGPHTGDISAEMLADAGASAVIVGHSERRKDHGETDALVNAKAKAAHRAGLTAIICVGETEQQRNEGKTLQIVSRSARRLAAERGACRRYRDRLRAGLGDRLGSDADARRYRRSAWLHSRRAWPIAGAP